MNLKPRHLKILDFLFSRGSAHACNLVLEQATGVVRHEAILDLERWGLAKWFRDRTSCWHCSPGMRFKISEFPHFIPSGWGLTPKGKEIAAPRKKAKDERFRRLWAAA